MNEWCHQHTRALRGETAASLNRISWSHTSDCLIGKLNNKHGSAAVGELDARMDGSLSESLSLCLLACALHCGWGWGGVRENAAGTRECANDSAVHADQLKTALHFTSGLRPMVGHRCTTERLEYSISMFSGYWSADIAHSQPPQ